MVNARFPRRHERTGCCARTRETRVITGLRSVNDPLSKPFEFSENSERIRIECGQKPQRGLQARLLLMCHAAK
jgi:hypothetical protein